MNNAFCENLRRLLDERGVSMSELASSIGVAQSTISMWCAGQRVPKMNGVQAVADFFNVDWQEMLESDEDKKKQLEAARFAELFTRLDDHGKNLVMTILMAELKKLPQIKEVRGRGLMIGIEFDEPIKEIRHRLLFEEHVFTGVSGTNVIRLLPPLTLSLEEAEEFRKRFRKILYE